MIERDLLSRELGCLRSSLLFYKRSTDNTALSHHQLGGLYRVPGKKLKRHYKDHLSQFNGWQQNPHAKQWFLFAQNLGSNLSLDETAFSNGDLYTILTNKKAKGKKGTLVAVVKGTNTSGITFEIDFLNIYRVSGNKKRKASYQKLPLKPIYKYKLPDKVWNGQSLRFVYVLPKFALGDKEKLQLELQELNGSRNLVLHFN
ncbi:DUF4138 domain-containing protein [Galbibacter sp. EGI 63066]|uniref:DUF4138 domain-containing protein n=1 Tax=Galbibacter sp. EGI 63066 TaxID=2993559 RepID=UPI002248A45F|nr:DUF4138 domain-containing protein [Galbibacter sp. EGI 63066]MCX2682155.1 DUF4138 domain-containing protein [Galbibacter sp. EGI 63066]